VYQYTLACATAAADDDKDDADRLGIADLESSIQLHASTDAAAQSEAANADADAAGGTSTSGTSPAATTSRRAFAALGGALLAAVAGEAAGWGAFAATGATAAPRVGDCADCVGVINDLLNSCPEETEACISSQNDGTSPNPQTPKPLNPKP
jgi:hypothetical protein